MTPGSVPLPPTPAAARQRRPGFPLMPLILLLLALLDLRVDLQLLSDHFTFSTLASALSSHPLAVAVLLFSPSLWRRYRT